MDDARLVFVLFGLMLFIFLVLLLMGVIGPLLSEPAGRLPLATLAYCLIRFLRKRVTCVFSPLGTPFGNCVTSMYIAFLSICFLLYCAMENPV